ncbi:hypothetical protein GCM10011405_13750 [Rufibacter glacialis]|nr:hypothetical protein GCM10011405_13750 [Rufibacter glacialis]
MPGVETYEDKPNWFSSKGYSSSTLGKTTAKANIRKSIDYVIKPILEKPSQTGKAFRFYSRSVSGPFSMK